MRQPPLLLDHGTARSPGPTGPKAGADGNSDRRAGGDMRRVNAVRRGLILLVGISMAHGPWPMSQAFVLAAERPSLFRGVVVAGSPLGVRVVSVEESSQAYQADLRPDDIVMRVGEAELRSIDEFALISHALKGRVVSTTVLIFRHGTPRELTVHLYSYPILHEWGVEFIPDHDIRFAEAKVGLDYWTRLGRGFEEAGKPEEALDAYLNGLHNLSTDPAMALKVSELFSTLSQRRLAQGTLADGVGDLHQALVVLERLFDYPLTDDQLHLVRRELQDTLKTLRTITAKRQDAPLGPSPR